MIQENLCWNGNIVNWLWRFLLYQQSLHLANVWMCEYISGIYVFICSHFSLQFRKYFFFFFILLDIRGMWTKYDANGLVICIECLCMPQNTMASTITDGKYIIMRLGNNSCGYHKYIEEKVYLTSSVAISPFSMQLGTDHHTYDMWHWIEIN